MYEVLRYIFKRNKGLSRVKYLMLGSLFQVFKRFSGSTISKTIFNGKKIFLYPDCNISSMYTYTKIPDEKEIKILRSLAKKKQACFLDIGANVGSYCISMCDVCSNVIAFEPHPLTSRRCKMNFLLNNLPESSVKQLALSNEIGSTYFSDYGASSTVNRISTSGSIEVKVNTLDRFIRENHFSKSENYIVKVDVEGFEEHVFEGGAEFFTKYNVEGIVFECFSQKNVFDILKSYGYKRIEKISENNYFATKN
jgi:FkbM family methyltransferase